MEHTPRFPSALVFASLLAATAASQDRTPVFDLPPQPPQLGGIVVSDLDDGQTLPDLVRTIVGPGVTATNITFQGSSESIARFTGGSAMVGFENGILLSTGRAGSVVGPLNQSDATSGFASEMGDGDLDALVSGSTTDATVLEFDFECNESRVIQFDYVFASEEYNGFVDNIFNDVFAFFLNGENIALVPGSTEPVSVNTVNCGFPYNPPEGGTNCDLYVNNDCYDLGTGKYPCAGAVPGEMNGYTVKLTAMGTLQPGTNHIKLAIADRLDPFFDSNLFLRAQSFGCALGPPFFIAPSPCGETLTASVGSTLEFTVQASASHGGPDPCVSLSVSGDGLPLMNGSFSPSLPTGCEQPASSTFSWIPGSDDVGTYTLVFTATDDLGGVETCEVTLEVAECFLLVGSAPALMPLPMGGPGDMLYVHPRAIYPVTMESIPAIPVPDVPGMMLARLYFQVTMVNPFADPMDPVKVSNGLEVRVGGPQWTYGEGSGIDLWQVGSAGPGDEIRVGFRIDGF